MHAVVALMMLLTQAGPEWSKPVDGVRGRLVVTPHEVGGKTQIAVELKLENLRDSATPVPVHWSANGDMLKFGLEENGKPVAQNGVGGNERSGPPFTVLLPVGSRLRVVISKAAYEYVPNGRVMLRPVALQGWDIAPKHGALALRAKFTPLGLDLPPVPLP